MKTRDEQRDEIALAARDAVPMIECHGLDTPERVCFYEQEFYVLSNFSAFRVTFNGVCHDTSEHAYHMQKFPDDIQVRNALMLSQSAHEAFKTAERYRDRRRPDWDSVKVDFMRDILRAKADQHEYVRRKLLETGDRELVENSWRDDFWGWGPNRDGKNMLGNLWMQIRASLRRELWSTGHAMLAESERRREAIAAHEKETGGND